MPVPARITFEPWRPANALPDRRDYESSEHARPAGERAHGRGRSANAFALHGRAAATDAARDVLLMPT